MLVRVKIEEAIREYDFNPSVQYESRLLAPGYADLWLGSQKTPIICVSTSDIQESVRIIVGPYAFEGIYINDVPEFVVNVLLGKYQISITRHFFIGSIWMRVKVGDKIWSEGRKVPQKLEWWEGDHLKAADS